jgi:hypothetical protein
MEDEKDLAVQNPVTESQDDGDNSGPAAAVDEETGDGGELFDEEGRHAVNPGETARLIQELVDARMDDTRLEHQADAALAQSSALASSALTAHLVRLAGAPASNLHQCTVYFLTSEAEEDAERRRKVGPVLLAVGYSVVLVQAGTASQLFWGSTNPSYKHNDYCDLGFYCGELLNSARGQRQCFGCGTSPPILMQTDVDGNTYNKFNDPNFVGYNTTALAMLCADPVPSDGVSSITSGVFEHSLDGVVAFCERCFHPSTTHPTTAGTIDPMTLTSRAGDLVSSMDPFDWLALTFSATVVAFAVCKELFDIELCSLALNQATGGAKAGTRLAIRVLNGIRRWVFLPCLMTVVPLLVVVHGSDALSVCFNTVAILFMTEIDNLCYAALSRDLRERMEEAGRVTMTREQTTIMSRSRLIHVCGIVVAVLIGVNVGFTAGAPGLVTLPLIPFLIGAAFEAFTSRATPATILCEVAKAFGAAFVGLCCWFVSRIIGYL